MNRFFRTGAPVETPVEAQNGVHAAEAQPNAPYALNGAAGQNGHTGAPQQQAQAPTAAERIGDIPLVDLQGVTKAYHTPAGDFFALRGIDLRIKPGEFVALLGRSGAGKSTLINVITGIDRPTAGTVQVAGEAIHSLSEAQITRWRGRQVGVIFQSFQLMPMLTCLQNVMLPMDFAGLYKSPGERRARAMQLLEQMEITQHADKLPSAVSGGQRQRVAIARVLLKNAPILVLDEATSALDSEVEAVIQENLYRLMQGKTVIAIAHRLSTIAAMDRLVVMDAGHIVEEGSHEQLLARGGLYAQLWQRQSGGFLALAPTADEA
jgi:ABC-type multidrug transport system fused ATPase/permease subunit